VDGGSDAPRVQRFVGSVFRSPLDASPPLTVVVAEIYSTVRNDKYLNDLLSRIGIEPSVSSVSWERVQ
jgi:hypothetical protein